MEQRKARRANEAGRSINCKDDITTTQSLKHNQRSLASRNEIRHECNSFAQVKGRARDRWGELLAALGVDAKYLTRRHGPCPGCGGKDRFRYTDRGGDGGYICSQCGGGDGFKLIQIATGASLSDVLRQVASMLPSGCARCDSRTGELRALPARAIVDDGREAEKRQQEIEYRAKMERLRDAIWSEALPVKAGDPVHTYLTSTRRLPLTTIPIDLQLHLALAYYEHDGNRSVKVGEYPAMVAAVRDVNGVLLTLHRTYLTGDGRKLGDVDPTKTTRKMLPGLNATGGAIRLGDAGEELVIAEGIETALAASILSGLPSWAAISASGLERVIIPRGVERAVICVDNDAAGIRHSKRLAVRLSKQGVEPFLANPSAIARASNDWADVFDLEVA